MISAERHGRQADTSKSSLRAKTTGSNLVGRVPQVEEVKLHAWVVKLQGWQACLGASFEGGGREISSKLLKTHTGYL
jgi:hypothetical protein